MSVYTQHSKTSILTIQDQYQYYIVIAENVNGNNTSKSFFSNISSRKRNQLSASRSIDNPQEPNEELPTFQTIFKSLSNNNKILVDEYQTKLKDMQKKLKTVVNRAQLDQIHDSLWIPLKLEGKEPTKQKEVSKHISVKVKPAKFSKLRLPKKEKNTFYDCSVQDLDEESKAEYQCLIGQPYTRRISLPSGHSALQLMAMKQNGDDREPDVIEDMNGGKYKILEEIYQQYYMVRVHKAPAVTPDLRKKVNLTSRDVEKIREFRLRRKYTDRAISNLRNKKFSSNLSKTSDSINCSMEISSANIPTDKVDLRQRKKTINRRQNSEEIFTQQPNMNVMKSLKIITQPANSNLSSSFENGPQIKDSGDDIEKQQDDIEEVDEKNSEEVSICSISDRSTDWNFRIKLKKVNPDVDPYRINNFNSMQTPSQFNTSDNPSSMWDFQTIKGIQSPLTISRRKQKVNQHEKIEEEPQFIVNTDSYELKLQRTNYILMQKKLGQQGKENKKFGNCGCMGNSRSSQQDKQFCSIF